MREEGAGKEGEDLVVTEEKAGAVRCKDYCYYLGQGGSWVYIGVLLAVVAPPLLIGLFQYFLSNLVSSPLE